MDTFRKKNNKINRVLTFHKLIKHTTTKNSGGIFFKNSKLKFNSYIRVIKIRIL